MTKVVRNLLLLVSVVVLSVVNSTAAFALKTEQKRVIQSGSSYFNVEETRCVVASSPDAVTPGGTIYVLGDSLTVGMQSAGLDADLRAAGWTPTKINAIGGKNLGWGLEQVTADASLISGSDSILIGLGTNNVGTVVDGSTEKVGGKDSVKRAMQDIIDQVKTSNADIKIYWTNIYITGTLTTRFGTFDLDLARTILNAAISEVAAESGVGIVPWGTSTEAPTLISSDGIHPSGKYAEMTDYIVGQLSNTSAPVAQPGNCSCSAQKPGLIGTDNQQRAFNYYVSKGYKPEWAAGIVGNMIHESSVEPMRLQNTASGVETSSSTLEASGDLTNNNVGWGLVQWTPPSKLVATSRQAGIDFSTIDTMEYQLEFVWKQLEGTAIASNEQGAGTKLKETLTPEDAGFAFGRWYERFRDSENVNNPEHAARRASAREVFDIYAGATPGPIGAGVNCGTGAGANGWDLPGEGENPMVYYSQRKEGNDPAVQGYYGNQPYGPGPIYACGCGPTSWAMVVSTLTDTTVTPDIVANWAHDNGFQLPTREGNLCGGSAWWWSAPGSGYETKWGVTARLITIDDAAAALRAGALIMMSSSADATGVDSPFTEGGHLLVMRAVTDDGKYLFADPNDHDDKRAVAVAAFNGESKSRTPLAPEQFMPSTQGLWAITRSVTP